MSLGVAAGVRMANHELKKKPGRPEFRNGRYIGKLRKSALRRHPQQFDLAAPYQPGDGAEPLKGDRNLTAGDIGRGLRGALVGDMGQRYAGLRSEHRHRQMLRAAGTARTIVDLAGAAFAAAIRSAAVL